MLVLGRGRMEPRWWLLIGVFLSMLVHNWEDTGLSEDLRFLSAAGNPLGMLAECEDAVTQVLCILSFLRLEMELLIALA